MKDIIGLFFIINSCCDTIIFIIIFLCCVQRNLIIILHSWEHSFFWFSLLLMISLKIFDPFAISEKLWICSEPNLKIIIAKNTNMAILWKSLHWGFHLKKIKIRKIKSQKIMLYNFFNLDHILFEIYSYFNVSCYLLIMRYNIQTSCSLILRNTNIRPLFRNSGRSVKKYRWEAMSHSMQHNLEMKNMTYGLGNIHFPQQNHNAWITEP